ncbi:spore coat protein SP85-like isoform X4 [Branchiostoma floridae]|uniref:Spore coat protein SP85-like isoform X4 n=1 Tax=Branchiostoma floridae TaxID=7739 RepID=A0A9J7L7Q6_BRAFL|nr:spore coat protein SP85-like isoform X4 [Branchiostoma floridae]
MCRIAVLVLLVTIWTTVVAGEQCRTYGGITTFSCPRPYGIDDNDDIYCCKSGTDCCDDCWDGDDTSSCSDHWGNAVSSALRLGIGAIIGIIVGCIVLIIIVIVACVLCCCACAKGSSQRNQPQAVQMAPAAQPVQYPPGQYPQYPPAQPPAYPQYPDGQPPAYPQNPAYPPKV